MSFAPWQQVVLDQALRARVEGRLGHALLLVGPERMGKQAVAQVLAQGLLCSAPNANGSACGSCRACQLFVANTHGDYQQVSLELNDKGDKLRSEISVQQIRRLGQWFSLTPQLGGAQVAIIAPGEAMSNAAANALLKTLEEPAPNRFLLIVSSRPSRLPATIRSRCQRLEFRLPSPEQAMAWLRQQGFALDEVTAALEAARGHPGLAADWLGGGGLQLRRAVAADLKALGSGDAGPVELAQRWLADDLGELRLYFAADLALDAGAAQLGVRPLDPDGCSVPADFLRLSAWFDALNRVREQWRAPLRHDLILAGLLREWRTMFP